MALNPNQFKQEAIRGQLDLQIAKSGVISGQVAAGQATALKPGDAVKLDTGNTGAIPQFLKATEGQQGIGHVAYTINKSSFSAGDLIEVTFFGGPVMWMEAGGAIQPGAGVESEADGQVVTLAAAPRRGFALDPASGTGVLLRVIINPAPAA